MIICYCKRFLEISWILFKTFKKGYQEWIELKVYIIVNKADMVLT